MNYNSSCLHVSNLQQLIMQKAAEDLKKKNAEEAAAKKKIIDKRVPPLELAGMSTGRRCMHKARATWLP